MLICEFIQEGFANFLIFDSIGNIILKVSDLRGIKKAENKFEGGTDDVLCLDDNRKQAAWPSMYEIIIKRVNE